MKHLPFAHLALRTRLTIWYGALLALALLSFSMLLYFTLERNLSRSVDDALHLRAEQLRKSLLGPNIDILLQPEDIFYQAGPLEEFTAPGIYVQVLNARGAVVAAPTNLSGGELPVTETILDAMRQGEERMMNVRAADGTSEVAVRVLTVPLLASGRVVGAILVGQSLAPIESTMSAVARLLLATGAAALVLAMALGWLFTRGALAPLARVTATARHIATTGDYRQRLEVERHGERRTDELSALIGTFNDMIARLEHVLDSQRRLLADTSHELRNPLTVIRGNLALLRREQVPETLRQEAVAEADEEVARMGRLVNDLLLLARADAGQSSPMAQVPVDLGELAEEVVDRARARAGARSLAVQADGTVRVLGDRDRLTQLVANLVDNAIRYTPDDGQVRLVVRADLPAPVQQKRAATRSSSSDPSMATALLTVSDTGIGVHPGDLPHLFERFYRADKARSRAEGGTGLGLSIAEYIVQAHGGTIEAASDGPGQGTQFAVRLPLFGWEAPAVAPVSRGGPRLRQRLLRRRAAQPVVAESEAPTA